ncbi:hypothetical protein IKW72_03780 [bacterium]|nr:hypothetical protein [bacterium]
MVNRTSRRGSGRASNAPDGSKWYLRALILASRILASLAVLLMAYLFFDQLIHFLSHNFNDIIALTLIPILLSVCYVLSWKSLWWSAAGALAALAVFLVFMRLVEADANLPLEIIVLLNIPTPFLIVSAALDNYSKE